jgi:hypothetical protein
VKTPLRIRIFLLSLAALVLFNGFGFYMLAFAKTEIHRIYQRETASLQKLDLNSAEFSAISWIGKHDFIYKNHVYDCEEMTSSNGKISISCRADQEETMIKNALAESFDQQSPQNSSQKTNKELFKIFPVLPFEEKIFVAAPVLVTENMLSGFRDNSFCTPVREIASPPPKQA